MNNKKFAGFTLSEVLIALAIIGVIAAITIPAVIPFIQERVDTYRHVNIVHKITAATNSMRSLGVLNKFSDTDDFVDELEKHLKIAKRCDSDHIADCWPTDKAIAADGSEFEIKDLKTGKDLGFSGRNTRNVGIVLADGASIIMTYNPENEGLTPSDELIASLKELPVGGTTKEFLEYTTNSTAGLAFITDVNGGKKPNSETTNGKMHDIRSLNGAHLPKGCGGAKVGGTCYTPIDSHEKINCGRKNGNLIVPENVQYCGSESIYEQDNWAGAQKACDDIGARVPDVGTLQNICRNDSIKKAMGIGSNGHYVSSTSIDGSFYQAVLFSNGSCEVIKNSRFAGGRMFCIK